MGHPPLKFAATVKRETGQEGAPVESDGLSPAPHRSSSVGFLTLGTGLLERGDVCPKSLGIEIHAILHGGQKIGRR
jgi:hypothetical protein